MYDVSKEKAKIHKVIDNKVEEMKAEFDEIRKEIDEHETFAELIGELVEIFHNTPEQKNVIYGMFQRLSSDFFKNANLKRNVNSLDICSDGITIRISSSRIKSIDIILDEIEFPDKVPEFVSHISREEKIFHDNWAEEVMGGIENLSKTDLLELMRDYARMRMSYNTFLFRRRVMKNDEVRVFIEDIANRIRMDNTRFIQNIEDIERHEKLVEKYYEKESYQVESFYSFWEENGELFQEFKDNSWRINFRSFPDRLEHFKTLLK